MIANDLTREGDQFPLGSGPTADSGREAAVVPFGLRYATTPSDAATVDLDFSKISYDPESQIAILTDDDGTILPAMRHTSTKTKTETQSRDREGPDDDTDATGK